MGFAWMDFVGGVKREQCANIQSRIELVFDRPAGAQSGCGPSLWLLEASETRCRAHFPYTSSVTCVVIA
jgi:hypothetical protein